MNVTSASPAMPAAGPAAPARFYNDKVVNQFAIATVF